MGGHNSFEKPADQEDWKIEDEWGASARWMEIVQKRTEERLRESSLRRGLGLN